MYETQDVTDAKDSVADILRMDDDLNMLLDDPDELDTIHLAEVIVNELRNLGWGYSL